MFRYGVSAVVLAGLLPGLAGAARIPELNQKVVRYALAQKGKQVGNGECWTLADQALRAAGAQRPGRNGAGSSTFGRKLRPGEKFLPGDVMQFERVKFQHRSRRGSYSFSMPHHTAVVYRVAGKQVTLLHQNFNGKKTVQETTINLAHRTQGTVAVYRPRPAARE
jgi:hypothetical protein